MKFSVLLPTRNRLDLLRYAIETVTRQDYDDWEIVVSDNCSDEDACAYVATLQDERIRCFSTAHPVPVTDNWNLALQHSSGEYVLMLGDDDGLLQGYFRSMNELIERHSRPDFVYSDAIQFAYPGVIARYPEGFVQIGYARFFRRRHNPYLIEPLQAVALVRNSMNMRLSFGFNMQHSLVSRRMVEKLRGAGSFFQSPYPDYYASNALFLESSRILVVPRPMVVIGISPKSFGYFYFNDRQGEGSAFLDNMSLDGLPERTVKVLLPGNDLFSAWFLAMRKLEENFGAAHGLRTNEGRYRALQVLHLSSRHGYAARSVVWKDLSHKEKLLCGAWFWALRLLPGRWARRLSGILLRVLGPYPIFNARRKTVHFKHILELVDAMAPEYY